MAILDICITGVCNTGIITGECTYVLVDNADDKVFQVANMNTPELMELMDMYNRSCSHIDFDHVLGPRGALCLLLMIFLAIVMSCAV